MQKDDLEVAGRVIARAFHEDELTVHLYPESDSHARFALPWARSFLGEIDALED